MSHIVVTSTTTTTSSSTVGFFNSGYTHSLQGLLNVAQMVALLIAFLCVYCSPHQWDYTAFQYFKMVTLSFLIVLLIFYLMHVFRLQSKLTCINWTLTEFLSYAVGVFLVLIASIVAAIKNGGASELVAGSVFGFIATFLLAVSLWTSYKVTYGSQPTSAAV